MSSDPALPPYEEWSLSFKLHVGEGILCFTPIEHLNPETNVIQPLIAVTVIHNFGEPDEYKIPVIVLNEKETKGLIYQFQHWIDTGQFEPPVSDRILGVAESIVQQLQRGGKD